MSQKVNPNPLFYHGLIALILALWIVLFLVLIAPFDLIDVRFENRIIMMPGYGILFALSYLAFALMEIRFPIKKGWKTEILCVAFLLIVPLLPVFFYYSSNFIQGDYHFPIFVTRVYLPIFILLVPAIVLLRWFFLAKPKPEQQKILLGKKKYDQLSLRFDDLVFIKAADNYLEINYLEDSQLHQRLIRYTMKEVKNDVPDLLQTHRSYLVNPNHIIQWKNKNSLLTTSSEVPVSDSFRKLIPNLDQIHHK